MERRAFLATAGIAGVSKLSGCLEGDGDQPSAEDELRTESEPETKENGPALEVVDTKINEDPLTYGDEFTIDVTLANVGDEPIREESFTGSPAFSVQFLNTDETYQDNAQRVLAKVALEPGETAVETIGPFIADASGSWKISTSDVDYIQDGATMEFEVNPLHASLGEDIYVDSGLSISVERFQTVKSYFYEYIADRTEYEIPSISITQAPEESVYVVPELKLTNSLAEKISFGQNREQADYGMGQVAITPTEERTVDVEPDHTPELPGTYLGDCTVSSHETATAWIKETIPTERRDEATFEFRKWNELGPPEAFVEIEDSTLPQFELIEYIIPPYREGEQRIGVSIENVGDVTGEFRGIVQHTAGGREEFVDPVSGGELRATLDPGSYASAVVFFDHEPGTEYRFLPSGDTFEV